MKEKNYYAIQKANITENGVLLAKASNLSLEVIKNEKELKKILQKIILEEEFFLAIKIDYSLFYKIKLFTRIHNIEFKDFGYRIIYMNNEDISKNLKIL